MLTKNQNTLSILEGYKISFDTIPYQEKTKKIVYKNSARESVMDTEVSEMLKKRAISMVQDQ